MKKTLKLLLLLVAMALLLPSCNKGEGMGGTGTVQGFVKLVHHPDDDYTLTPDTVNAAKTDVFIVYGDENFFGDDIETGADGGYRFEYLRPGNYTVYAYSTLPSGQKVAVSETVELARGAVALVPTLYIHDGKAYMPHITTTAVGAVRAGLANIGSISVGWERRFLSTTPAWGLMAISVSKNCNPVITKCLQLPMISTRKSLILFSKASPSAMQG